MASLLTGLEPWEPWARTTDCPTCNGTGTLRRPPRLCYTCAGSGLVLLSRLLEFIEGGSGGVCVRKEFL